MREREVQHIHDAVRREGDAHRADEKTLTSARDRALERADRREWSQRKFAVGGEFRWQETVSEAKPIGRRRFVYDPHTDRVVEIN